MDGCRRGQNEGPVELSFPLLVLCQLERRAKTGQREAEETKKERKEKGERAFANSLFERVRMIFRQRTFFFSFFFFPSLSPLF